MLNGVDRGGNEIVYGMPLFVWLEAFCACHDIIHIFHNTKDGEKVKVSINRSRTVDGACYLEQDCLTWDIFEVIHKEWVGCVNNG